MKSALAISISALFLSVTALVGFWMNSKRIPEGSVEPIAPASTAHNAELLASIDALNERLARVELRPAPVAQRAPVGGGEEFVTREEFDALRAELQAALLVRAGSAGGRELQSDEFKQQLASTLTELRKDEVAEKFEAKHEKRTAQLDLTLPKLQDALGMTATQTNQMRSAMLAQYEREAELLRRWRAGEDDEVLGELKQSDQETHRAELREFLSEEQLETLGSLGGGRGK